jgi:GT2 family glycosyltransferase
MLNASIVLYKHTPSEIKPLVETLQKAKNVSTIFLIDNSPVSDSEFEKMDIQYIFNNKNLGYGAAHNIAMRKTLEENTPYHLVVNPDISFESEILEEIESFLNKNTEIAHLMPQIIYPNGEIQYLCKQIPTPFDLIFRRFLPAKWTKKRTEKFEMRKSGYNKIMDVPYLSGSFMFLRTKALKSVGLFDERFFMYPEDIDLTRRLHKKYRTVFYPDAKVIHNHAQASYKNTKMLYIHITNMIKYFNKWGWIFDSERKEINKKISVL